jgi:succinate dehydrogenase / fumarate reductase cytochrome b subunit
MEGTMNWLTNSLKSSIGKKLLMAITGFGFLLFLFGHLAGNLTIYGGKGAFNSYAEHLHALGPLLTAAEVGLILFALIHVFTGIVLFIQNLRSRPQRYMVNKCAGGRTIGSQTMPYTGILILFFVVFHLTNFSFVDKTNTTIYQIVSSAFSDPVYVLLYIAAMIVVALHVSHGFWSSFQTVGANHPKYMPFIMSASIAIAVLVGLGFGFIPVYISLIA